MYVLLYNSHPTILNQVYLRRVLALNNGTSQRTFLVATLSYQTPPMQMVRNSAAT
jgi:hypothetical protein